MAWGDAGTPITAMGRAAAATLAFRVGGELRVAAVVKASFVIAADGPMALSDPAPIVRADEHRDESPSSSLLAAGELVPYRPRTDVLFAGHACAPLDRPTPAMAVRLMVARGSDLVLDKRLAVRGRLDPSGRTREPAPFTVIRFGWELAAATPDNPVGIREGPGAWPHIVDPRQRDRAAGVGPISPRWPARRRLLPGGEGPFAAPIPQLPGNFAWAYFNAAPEDQRLDFLRGDEWIGFEGMSSQLPRVQSCLPGVRARARVYGAAAELRAGVLIPLEADTLSIDTDRLRCSVVWRGSFLVAREEDLAGLHVFAGVETAEHPLSFPASYVVQAEQAPPAPPQPEPEDLSQTMGIDALLAVPRAATPFERHDPAPRAPATVPAPPPAENTTVDFSDLLRRVAALPFAPSAAPPPREDAPRALPAATPFEQARPVAMGAPAPEPPAPPPRPRTEPVTAEMAPRPLPAATPFEQARLAPPPPPPIVEPLEEEPGEPPRTLGGFFLAAMARAAKSEARISR